MEIHFSSNRCKDMLTDSERLKKELSFKTSKALVKRLFELEAMDNDKELLSSGLDNPHYLKGNFKGYVAWSIDRKYRLILEFDECSDNKNNKVTIKGVVDYHGAKDEWIIA